MVLPIGIKQDHTPIAGCDVGAPLNPNIKKKLLIVTGVTTILFIAYVLIIFTKE